MFFGDSCAWRSGSIDGGDADVQYSEVMEAADVAGEDPFRV